MSGFLLSVYKLVKYSDLFAIPVQLTFRGERFFYTLCGGIFSIIFMILLTGVTIYKFSSHIDNPQYYSQPLQVTYEAKDIEASTATNTIAIGLDDIDEDDSTTIDKYEIVFEKFNKSN